ncbi:MAG: hypothetical protein H6730_23040 [Deltaproteobacteria bacterium]|nr:hypothetical protein [Deltaproteobacteria bacterium]
MRRTLACGLVAATMACGQAPEGTQVASSSLTAEQSSHGRDRGLQPGQQVTLRQRVPVKIVLVGYDPAAIDPAAIQAELPATYQPVVRYPEFYGINTDTGVEFTFEYDVEFASQRFTDDYFAYIASAGTDGPMTLFQQAYNDNETNVLDITGPVLYVDGPSAEAWLASHYRSGRPHRHHGEAEEGYTVFFINWFGRPDFRFHVYTKTDDLDPDTGFNFGVDSLVAETINWGGSNSRTMFVDLSAGPEWNSVNWLMDVRDLDGDGVEEYRMPPIWEYVDGGYRAPTELSRDLGLITRFVGIDLLFTPSPLYDPMVTAPGLGGSKVTHLEVFEDDPASLGTDWLKGAIVRSEFEAFEPYHRWSSATEDNNPIDAGAQLSLRIFAGLSDDPGCYAFDPFEQLGCYFAANAGLYVPSYGAADYVAKVFAFSTTDEGLGFNLGLLGFADDNGVDGTQEHVYQFTTPLYRDLGYGMTTTTVHELGHHFGLSHPHDGYDAELAYDFGAGGDTFFAWLGDASGSVMHYLGTEGSFGVFNQDTMYRYETAGYINLANAVAGAIELHPRAHRVRAQVRAADHLVRASRDAFEDWNYLTSVTLARRAYERLLGAASALGIDPNVLIHQPNAQPQPRQNHVCVTRGADIRQATLQGATPAQVIQLARIHAAENVHF